MKQKYAKSEHSTLVSLLWGP